MSIPEALAWTALALLVMGGITYAAHRWEKRDHRLTVHPDDAFGLLRPEQEDAILAKAEADARRIRDQASDTPIFDTVAAYRAEVEAELTDANLAARVEEWSK